MANMFETIEKQGGSGGPQWLSDHPNPGDRSGYITREAQLLRVENPVRDARPFAQVQTHLKRLPPAPTTEQATKDGARTRGTSGSESRLPAGRVEAPSASFETYTEGNLFRVSVPSNWREMQSDSSVTFAPDGAYGQNRGQSVFTHGVEIGVARNEAHDLQTASNELLDSLAKGNPRLRRASGSGRVTIGDRPGLRTVLSNTSEVTGQGESIEVYTTQLRNGNLFYAVAVSPSDAYASYRSLFNRIVGSIQLLE